QFNTECLSAAACKDLTFNFAMGAATSSGAKPVSTCKDFVSRATYPFGDIFHATPTVVGPPQALLRDASYTAFGAETAAANKRAIATRPTVLFTATNDGILHAFDINVTTKENNEIWGFMPPATYKKLHATYPAGH